MVLKDKSIYSVLLVDDDPSIIELFKECLEDLSFYVLTALDGEDALKILAKSKVDCIITDISMPKISGPELIERLHEQEQLPPFFYITAYLEHPREDLNRYKPRAIIFKPFDFEEAALLIKNHLMRI